MNPINIKFDDFDGTNANSDELRKNLIGDESTIKKIMDCEGSPEPKPKEKSNSNINEENKILKTNSKQNQSLSSLM